MCFRYVARYATRFARCATRFARYATRFARCATRFARCATRPFGARCASSQNNVYNIMVFYFY